MLYHVICACYLYLPTVLDFIEDQGSIYTVMDYIPGEPFENLLNRGVKFTQAQVAKYAAQLGQVLVYLHGQKTPIVHGDIKPANIMLTPEDNICLIDFNISQLQNGAVSRNMGYREFNYNKGHTNYAYLYFPVVYKEGKFVEVASIEVKKEEFIQKYGTKILDDVKTELMELSMIGSEFFGEQLVVDEVSLDKILYNDVGVFYLNYKAYVRFVDWNYNYSDLEEEPTLSYSEIQVIDACALLEPKEGNLCVYSCEFGKYDECYTESSIRIQDGYPDGFTPITNNDKLEAYTIRRNNESMTVSEIGNALVGDIVTFGAYEQDNDLKNGAEPIEWYVLEKVDGQVTLLSLHIIDAKPYNENCDRCDWESCTLRTWLNDEFFKLSFDEVEKNAIQSNRLNNPGDPFSDASSDAISGQDTIDKVFLLSSQDIEQYFGIPMTKEGCPFYNGIRYMPQEALYCYQLDYRIFAKPTLFAKEKGIDLFAEEDANFIANLKGYDCDYAIGGGAWVLRTISDYGVVANVNEMGSAYATSPVDYPQGVRPVIRVKYQ